MEEEVKTELETSDVAPAAAEADEDDYSADIVPDDEDAAEEDDLEFEYDEDGNIVIPGDDGEADEEGDTTPNDHPSEAAPPPETDPAPAEKPPVESEAETLRRELDTYKARTRAALKKMGYESENILDSLDQMGAEADGKTVEEYRAEIEAETKKKAAEDADFNTRFAAKKAADLAAVHAAYPEAKKYTDVDQFPNASRFKLLMDGGATAEEAFRATHPEEVAAHVATAVKQGARDSKEHLRSNVPRGAKDTSVQMTREELADYREMFPGLTDKEIVKLYRSAKK